VLRQHNSAGRDARRFDRIDKSSQRYETLSNRFDQIDSPSASLRRIGSNPEGIPVMVQEAVNRVIRTCSTLSAMASGDCCGGINGGISYQERLGTLIGWNRSKPGIHETCSTVNHA